MDSRSQDVENLLRDEQKKVKKRKKVAKSTLSFALDDFEGDGEHDAGGETKEIERPSKKAKSRKNPNVDTSFLPDREREEQERREREELRQEWLRKQEEMKNEEIEIVYSYWDGSGHRKSVTVGLFTILLENIASDHAGHCTSIHGLYIVQERRRDLDFPGEMPTAIPRASGY